MPASLVHRGHWHSFNLEMLLAIRAVIAIVFCAIAERSRSSTELMYAYTENQSWIVVRGDEVVQKMAAEGRNSLSDIEKLICCLWTADYMMRNAGDFANAEDMYPTFQVDAAKAAKKLGLSVTDQAFSLSRRNLEREYLDRFEAICEEIKNADRTLIRG
jgi:hypothetical protein